MKVIVLSGKRYAGKDALAAIIQQQYPKWIITPIAQACKAEYAENSGADLDRLMNDQAYKEIHRKGIIQVADDRRREDSEYWIRLTLLRYQDCPGVIISDMRFMAEYEYIRTHYPTALFVRVVAEDETRVGRGWKYDPVIDDSPTETCFDKWRQWNGGVVFNDYKTLEIFRTSFEGDIAKALGWWK